MFSVLCIVLRLFSRQDMFHMGNKHLLVETSCTEIYAANVATQNELLQSTQNIGRGTIKIGGAYSRIVRYTMLWFGQ